MPPVHRGAALPGRITPLASSLRASGGNERTDWLKIITFRPRFLLPPVQPCHPVRLHFSRSEEEEEEEGEANNLTLCCCCNIAERRLLSNSSSSSVSVYFVLAAARITLHVCWVLQSMNSDRVRWNRRWRMEKGEKHEDSDRIPY